MTPTWLTDVDGIPVLLAPTAGPMRAGLMFRVGRVDESLATTGITHLVEHLALHRHGTADYHYNGMTSATTTQFVMQGTPGAVASFLNDVCASLQDLPLGRLAAEKKILETEAANRSPAINEQMPLWRHGARDYGLLSYPEWGLRTLTTEQVREWARTRFTRGNAVLWIAGDRVPDGLKLDLQDGARWPLPKESSALPVMPAYFATGSPLIVMDAQVPRTRAAVLYTRLLERALFRELRQNQAISYTAAAMYSTDGREHGTLTAVADAQHDKVDNALEYFLSELAKLETQDIDPAEFEAVRALDLEAFDNPEVEANLLPRRATDLLTGFRSATTDELVDGFRKASAGDIREVAHTVKASALLMVPYSVSRTVTGFEAAPTSSRFGVTGIKYPSRSEPGIWLVRGQDGLSLTGTQGSATVLFEQCEALLRWPDGARHLFGADGINVRIEPGLFKVPAAVLTKIDHSVPSHAIIEMPQRDEANIPKPNRAKGIRARIRKLFDPWRARIDHAGVTRGGTRGLLIAALLIATTITTGILAVANGHPRYFTVAVIAGVVLVWRRRNLGHW